MLNSVLINNRFEKCWGTIILYFFLLTQVDISFIFHNILGLNLIIYFSLLNSKIFLVQAFWHPSKLMENSFLKKKKKLFLFLFHNTCILLTMIMLLGHWHLCPLHYSN